MQNRNVWQKVSAWIWVYELHEICMEIMEKFFLVHLTQVTVMYYLDLGVWFDMYIYFSLSVVNSNALVWC